MEEASNGGEVEKRNRGEKLRAKEQKGVKGVEICARLWQTRPQASEWLGT